MHNDSPPRWQREGSPPAIVLIGMSGVGKSFWSARYGQKSSAEEIQDTTSETKEKLRSSGAFLHISADDEIAKRIRPELSAVGVANDKEPVEMLAEYIGKFGAEQHGGLSRDDFFARQEAYRNAELKSIEKLPSFLKSVCDKPPCLRHIILYDTTGSFCEVVKNVDKIYTEIAHNAIIVYLACSEQEEEVLLYRQIKNPKPMLYDKGFFDTCLHYYLCSQSWRKKEFGRSDEEIIPDEEIVPDDFLRFIFPRLLNRRRKLYEDLAQATITTAELEEIYYEESPGQFPGNFLNLARSKYEEGKSKG